MSEERSAIASVYSNGEAAFAAALAGRDSDDMHMAMEALRVMLELARLRPTGRDDLAILAATAETAAILSRGAQAPDAFSYIAERLANELYHGLISP